MTFKSTSVISAESGSIAVGGNLSIGIPPELLLQILVAARGDWNSLTEEQRASIHTLEGILGGIPQKAVLAFFRTIDEASVPFEKLEARLLEIADSYRKLKEQVSATPDDTQEVARLKNKVSSALDAGELEQADEWLGELFKFKDTLIEKQQIEAAEIAAQRGELALTQLQYEKAAEHFRVAYRRVENIQPEEAFKYAFRVANTLSHWGDQLGKNEILECAIAEYQLLLKKNLVESDPLKIAMIQNNLGNALSTLGARESGTTQLEEAVEAYLVALEELTRERVPLDWAMTQNNLGTVLSTLGERESGTTRLEEAVEAYRTALQERTRERVPLGWAMTQNNLGNALSTIGARESGTTRLEEAAEAYRAALQEYTRERVPLDWAMTQNNLGTVLTTLGERESGTTRLEEAVEAYRAALQEYTLERVPLFWATTQNNLAKVLRLLEQRGSGFS